MNVQEYNAMKARRSELNERQEKLRLEAQQLVAMAETARDNRAKIKAVVAELDQKLQAYEREIGVSRAPHPDKHNVIVERVPVTVEVEKPVTFSRALKKLFTGRG